MDQFRWDKLSTLSYSQLSGIAVLSLFLVIIIQRLNDPLAKIPGPWYAAWTSYVLVYKEVNAVGPLYVQELHKKYGPIVRVSRKSVDVSDPECAKMIHSVKAGYVKSKWYTQDRKDRDNVFNLRDVAAHRQRRKLLSHPFSESNLKATIPLIEEKVQLAMKGMKDEMKRRGATDVYNWWMFFTTDTIGELSFGESFNMLESGEKNQYIKDLEAVGYATAISELFPVEAMDFLGRFLRIPFLQGLADAEERRLRYADESLARYEAAKAEEGGSTKPMLFSRLIHAQVDGESLARTEIRNEAELFITAGSDTTSNTLTYLTWAVCKRPEIKARLLRELAALPRDFTDADLRGLRYLDMVITETLRRYPVAPSALHRVVPREGAAMRGHWLPGGAVVRTQNWSLHMNEAVFPDPMRFDPGRWECPSKAMTDAIMPFGGGSRICIGMHLAYIEMRLGIAHFFRTFPDATPSTLEGFGDADMEQLLYFLSSPKNHRCLIEAR
ncbi:cytochrome P450 [Xylariomycetidae sp. FL0641]|nr:cytochrome P450 [Xylariomycetidae sp. FL0641]